MKVLSTTWDTITPSFERAILKLFLDQKLQVWAILGPLHTLDWRPVAIAFKDVSLIEKAETIQVHFTLESEGLRAQRNYHGWNVYMDSYMIDCDYCFMVCQKLH